MLSADKLIEEYENMVGLVLPFFSKHSSSIGPMELGGGGGGDGPSSCEMIVRETRVETGNSTLQL